MADALGMIEARSFPAMVEAAESLATNASIVPIGVSLKAPLVAGKSGPALPVTYTSPASSTAMPSASSLSVPPR